MIRFCTQLLLFAWFSTLAAPPVRAEDNPRGYALVLGSNAGGAGQAALAYAEHDAERVAETLAELGRTEPGAIRLLRHPDVATVRAALSELRAELTVDAAAGRRTRLFFYYSGHARARSLSLGAEELPLDELRAALLSLPTTVTVVVLDACQSGAFSGVKGAGPAADFSISSVSGLASRGVAVMASSTGSELSQESSELGSGYFTHHLLVALRGPGDRNADGRVSLDEAYGYAYERALSDTARTQVGSQHATLETDLTGRGDLPLSYPEDADAQLVLPAAIEGRVLVQRERRGAVMAELVKPRGTPLALALPHGRYDVLVRATGERTRAKACTVSLAQGASFSLELAACSDVELPSARGKGASPPSERWFFELGLTGNSSRDDAYVHTLTDFRFQEEDAFAVGLDPLVNVELAAGVGLSRHLSVLARADTLESRKFSRTLQGPDGRSRDETFVWATRAVSLGARGRLPLLSEWLVLFAEGDVGLGFGRTQFSGTGVNHTEHYFGVALRGDVGATFGITRHVGLYLSGGYTYAPVIRNGLDETHDDGGFTLATGLRLRSLEGWW